MLTFAEYSALVSEETRITIMPLSDANLPSVFLIRHIATGIKKIQENCWIVIHLYKIPQQMSLLQVIRMPGILFKEEITDEFYSGPVHRDTFRNDPWVSNRVIQMDINVLKVLCKFFEQHNYKFRVKT